MAIPEDQLETWTGLGSVQQSAATYKTIKSTLEHGSAPYASKQIDSFLQGSYGNDTNIFGDSDVDIVLRTRALFHYNIEALPEWQKTLFKAAYPEPAQYQLCSRTCRTSISPQTARKRLRHVGVGSIHAITPRSCAPMAFIRSSATIFQRPGLFRAISTSVRVCGLFGRDGDPIEKRPGFTSALARIAGNGVRTIIVETANGFARDPHGSRGRLCDAEGFGHHADCSPQSCVVYRRWPHIPIDPADTWGRR